MKQNYDKIKLDLFCRGCKRWRVSEHRGLCEPWSLLSCGNSFGILIGFCPTLQCQGTVDGKSYRVCSTSDYLGCCNFLNRLAERGWFLLSCVASSLPIIACVNGFFLPKVFEFLALLAESNGYVC